MAIARRAAILSVLLVAGAADGLADGWEAQPLPSVAYAYHPEEMSWTGVYVGGHFGLVYTDTQFDYAATPLVDCVAVTGTADDCHARGNANSNSLLGGLQAGYNHQFDRLILGLEGDVTWRGQDNGKATFLPAFGVIQDFSENNDWLITLRARLGFAYYRAFLYATGGAAWSSVSHTVSFHDPTNVFTPLTVHESATRTGWTLGTGVEYALTSHLSFKGEYLFIDLGSVTVPTPATGGWWATSTRFSEEEHILRVGLNYRFCGC